MICTNAPKTRSWHSSLVKITSWLAQLLPSKVKRQRVNLGGAKTKNTTDALVKELIYLGDHIRCRMEVHGNDEFIVKVPNAAGHKHLVKGEKTTVSWAKEDCRALDA